MNHQFPKPPSGKPVPPLAQQAKTSVYLIDDHPMIVRGISLLIDAELDMRVVGSSSQWTVALKEIEQLHPDVVLLDVRLASANGLEVLKNLKTHLPEQKVLMLSMHDENLYAMRALKAGANGYLSKASATDEVTLAIRQVTKGEVYVSAEMAKLIMSRMTGRKTFNDNPLLTLSDRELEVYHLVGDGLTTRNIAEQLFLSIKTIETHKAHLKEKLNLQTAGELTRHALQAKS